jgi:spore coat polysaccharide biosynthesis protein SpsF
MDHGVDIVTGDEMDVLGRYVKARDIYDADYVCRITSDCSEIPAPLISKHIFTAMNHDLDYCSNVTPECRTYLDGWDCEVISKDLLEWLHKNADEPKYREHVTLLLQHNTPKWISIGHVLAYCDNSATKLSIDTQEDLEFARMYVDLIQSKINYAKNNGSVVVRW